MKRSPPFGSKAHTDFLRKAREDREKPDPMNSDPFYILGRLAQVINGSSIPGISRSPTQRLAAARSILKDWKDAKP